MSSGNWKVKIAPSVCEALGVQMYSTLPPVINELISNSYDADATIVEIIIDNNRREIICHDNGCGMSSKDIEDKFLVVSRNRREKDNRTETPRFKRKITGRKGLGKLSVFGVCRTIYVETVRNGKINIFEIVYEDLIGKNENEFYCPREIKNDEDTNLPNGTKIILKELTRKTDIDLTRLAKGCAKRSNFFGENFQIICSDKNFGTKIILNEQYRKEQILKNKQFEWNIPNDLQRLKLQQDTIDFFNRKGIYGFVLTTEKPIPEVHDEMEQSNGIALFARKKLCQEPSFFDIGTDKSHAYSYMYGEIHVDYIDNEKDNISTYRGNVVWNNDDMLLLRENLQFLIKAIGRDWRRKRSENKIIQVKKDLGFEIDQWYSEYAKSERELAKKITDTIIENENINIDDTRNLLSYIEGAFNFKTFRDFAESLSENNLDNSNLIRLLKDWKFVEAKEFYRVCIGRLEVIKRFEQMVKTDTLEVVGKNDIRDSMHAFFKEFPWIIEPRLSSMEDEVKYSDLLKEKFHEECEEKDRRIDFLCKGFNGDLYIIEIKRSQKSISKEDLDQLRDYCEFMEKYIAEHSVANNDRARVYHNIKGYIIGKDLKESAQIRARDMAKQNRYFLAYQDVLEQAKKYHQDFIDKHQEINEKLYKYSFSQSPDSLEEGQHSQSDEQ